MNPEPHKISTVVGVVVPMRPRELGGAPHVQTEDALRCVSSGYLAGGCSCPSTIPSRVVAAAWARQQARGETGQDGMFRFGWQGELWLAFGTAGRVRGVYCPTHMAEREARTIEIGLDIPFIQAPGLAPAA
jgi:hypothetical protein